jgi:hypothetical protein
MWRKKNFISNFIKRKTQQLQQSIYEDIFESFNGVTFWWRCEKRNFYKKKGMYNRRLFHLFQKIFFSVCEKIGLVAPLFWISFSFTVNSSLTCSYYNCLRLLKQVFDFLQEFLQFTRQFTKYSCNKITKPWKFLYTEKKLTGFQYFSTKKTTSIIVVFFRENWK